MYYKYFHFILIEFCSAVFIQKEIITCITVMFPKDKTVFIKNVLRESWVNGITATSSRGNASMALQNFSRDLFYESLKCILDSRFGLRFAGGQHPLRAT